MIIEDMPYKIHIKSDNGKYWNWCCANLENGAWKMMFGFVVASATYYFQNGEDATMFKLAFGL